MNLWLLLVWSLVKIINELLYDGCPENLEQNPRVEVSANGPQCLSCGCRGDAVGDKRLKKQGCGPLGGFEAVSWWPSFPHELWNTTPPPPSDRKGTVTTGGWELGRDGGMGTSKAKHHKFMVSNCTGGGGEQMKKNAEGVSGGKKTTIGNKRIMGLRLYCFLRGGVDTTHTRFERRTDSEDDKDTRRC